MAKRNIPVVKVYRRRKAKPKLPSPEKPRVGADDDTEALTGQVGGMKASAPEERLIRGLEKHPRVTAVSFRYAVGAPRGLPGWKEVDAVVSSFGQVYAIEVDTEFTHRDKKQEADRLHDVIVLNALRAEGLNVYPQVIHLDGESELADRKNTDNTIKRIFG